jgi:acyl-CoA thioester hydrolase
MNSMWYVEKFDKASWQLLARLGLSRLRFHEQGVGMVAAEQHIEYKRELLAGDIVSVSSVITDVMDKALRMVHEMRNDDTGLLAARTTIVGVHLDSKARRALSLPVDVRARARMMALGFGSSDSGDSALQPVSGGSYVSARPG